jgi:hypothetical protein
VVTENGVDAIVVGISVDIGDEIGGYRGSNSNGIIVCGAKINVAYCSSMTHGRLGWRAGISYVAAVMASIL